MGHVCMGGAFVQYRVWGLLRETGCGMDGAVLQWVSVAACLYESNTGAVFRDVGVGLMWLLLKVDIGDVCEAGFQGN